MNLKNYTESLTHPERLAFAKRANTSWAFICHILAGTKKPSTLELLTDLVAASGGKLTIEELRPDLLTGSKRANERYKGLCNRKAA